MSLLVVEPGLYSLVVDQGRPRSRSLGVPVGGAADRTSFLVGNALVGNPPDAPALEITLAGPTLRATCPLGCVVFGAPFDLHSDRQTLRVGKTFTLSEGEELHVGGTHHAMRAYFCVRGGLSSPEILASRTALAPLHAGQDLPCVSSNIRRRFGDAALPSALAADTFRVLPGPQAEWFPQGALNALSFTVSSASNRMGLRLQGSALAVPLRELISEPVCPGSIQVTRDGQCILLGVDGQTIGGYPKVAQVISADLDRLGQLRPGTEVKFAEVSHEEAEHLYRRQQVELNRLLLRVRASLW